MEINPYVERLRILEQVDSVQMQREASPDGEREGCPGCPYFWTCPVPHRTEDVPAPQEIEYADVADQLPARSEYRPRDESDIGFIDEWIEDDEPADEGFADAADDDLDAVDPDGADDPDVGMKEPAVEEPQLPVDGSRASDPRPRDSEVSGPGLSEPGLSRPRPRRGLRALLRRGR